MNSLNTPSDDELGRECAKANCAGTRQPANAVAWQERKVRGSVATALCPILGTGLALSALSS